MVREEKVKRHQAELLATEANMKLDALQAETDWRRSQMSPNKKQSSPNKSFPMNAVNSQSYPPPSFEQNAKPVAGIMQWFRSLNQTESDDVSTIQMNDAGDAELARIKEVRSSRSHENKRVKSQKTV